MAILIKGSELAQKIRENIKNEVSSLGIKPGIAVVIVGEDPASKVYVGRKEKATLEAGFNSIVIKLDKKITQAELEIKIDELNTDNDIHAILVQLPLPKHINSDEIIQKILPHKDVDGFHPLNVGKLWIGLQPYSVPCTPYGIIKLLEENNIQISGKHAVIIGRSNIVGKPMASLLLSRNATVTVCHSRTANLKEIASQADILVSAIGKPAFISEGFIKEGAVVIDVGINRMPDGKLTGDVDFNKVEQKAGYITPVPGGVGPMTIAMLLYNALNLCKRSGSVSK
ncbi:MAG: bifunctional methylenetetrahydrofolate dehydrogenase/methenyltetrahydrofolate cyclohydrolase FolD [Candidatus Gastranaerophilales bacterium]|nr:bifunctional methylenetetrahydrofolate dehydrogenase/methenyltetrahydrofolate cyclohydrolase FolD [Candidatus Gastranaerophilales bacterium]